MAFISAPPIGTPNRAVDHFNVATATSKANLVAGTWYLNDAGCVIALLIGWTQSAASQGRVEISPDGGTTTYKAYDQPGAQKATTTIVPPGWSYRVVCEGGATVTGTDVHRWVELF
jgi:hypothetical protein